MKMLTNLPKIIASYFTADSESNADITQYFAKDAIVKDERQTYTRKEAIRKWKEDVGKKFSYRSTPVSAEENDGQTVVKSKLVGNFPGSPIMLRYIFSLEDDKITYLEITP